MAAASVAKLAKVVRHAVLQRHLGRLACMATTRVMLKPLEEPSFGHETFIQQGAGGNVPTQFGQTENSMFVSNKQTNTGCG